MAIELIRGVGRTSGDVALAVLFYGGIAGGVVIISPAPGGTPANLNAYLFGAITTTTPQRPDGVRRCSPLLSSVVTLGLGRYLFAVSHDEEFAGASGLPVLALNLLLAVVTAATVVVVHAGRRSAADQRADGGARRTAQLLAGSFRGTVRGLDAHRAPGVAPAAW